jgi:hypothetical protein
MVQNARECLTADVAAADMLVTVNAGAERSFGIVDMDDTDVFEAEGGIGLGESAVEPLGRANVKASSEQMGSIETHPGVGHNAAGAAGVEHIAEMNEFSSEPSSLPCGVFEEDADRRMRRADTRVRPYGTRRLRDGFSNVLNAAGDAGVACGAGMDDQVVGTKLAGADDFVAESVDRALPLERVG